MVIHLHVGANRAGSSAIQHFCGLNTDLLSAAGFVYSVGGEHRFRRATESARRQ